VESLVITMVLSTISESAMNYKETLDFLFSTLPMFQRIGASAYKANLDNTIAFDEYLDHPHTSFRNVHIAGTNGKGSVCHMLAAILQEAGYKTGLYTSPHMKDFRERIRINGQCIPETEVAGFVEVHKPFIEKIKPSFFEMTVAMAFDYFRREKVDIAVIETGLGGRLDSTNIIEPVVSVITNIGLDHTNFLGNTLDKIAGEKAGIIKYNTPVIIGETQEVLPVFIKKANEMNAPLHLADQWYRLEEVESGSLYYQAYKVYTMDNLKFDPIMTDLPGNYQRKNIATVLRTVDIMKEAGFDVPDRSLLSGIRNVKKLTGLRGRWEVLDTKPLIVCDTGHNREGLIEVVKQISRTPHKQLHFIFGTVSDKDPSHVLKVLPKEAIYYFTQAPIPRAMAREELAGIALKIGLRGKTYPTPPDALKAARAAAGKEDLIFVGGSTFIVAEVIQEF
jgi:dihydrofolate synthase/folylpolyglutamate synthase